MRSAQNLFLRIGHGKSEMIKRPADPVLDRDLRRIINSANKNGDCIINTGDGYYRPRPWKAEEEKEFKEYTWKELGRGRDILYKRLKMQETFEKWREYGILHHNSRETGQPE